MRVDQNSEWKVVDSKVDLCDLAMSRSIGLSGRMVCRTFLNMLVAPERTTLGHDAQNPLSCQRSSRLPPSGSTLTKRWAEGLLPRQAGGSMTPQEFIRKWRAVELKERSASQSHFTPRLHPSGRGQKGMFTRNPKTA